MFIAKITNNFHRAVGTKQHLTPTALKNISIH